MNDSLTGQPNKSTSRARRLVNISHSSRATSQKRQFRTGANFFGPTLPFEMSSRALRRIQREQEEARLAQQEEEESEEEEPQPRPAKKSAFELLNAAEDDDEDEEEADAEADEVADPEPIAAPKASQKSKKKKKKKGKGKAPATTTPAADSDLDEIDKALQSLKTSEGSHGKAGTEARPTDELLRFYSLLAVNRNDLNPINEMKKLFGSAVLERDDDEEGADRRRQRGPQQLNLEQALSARFNQASKGQGLSGLALRQNVFMAGKPTWPRLPSGGLSMEIVEKMDDFTVEYRFVHKLEYQRAQKKFEDATQTLQADAVIALAIKQPYHIATLLQMAEILKQQGDHSLAGDLYERALYGFGRSVQSTFGSALSEGKARMDFRRPENREFWLTAWRYIGSLVQRGTFRTAYEWAKLLLSLDPEGEEGDPYRVRLIIDQLALKGGQFRHLIDLASTRINLIDWGQDLPNVRISLGLAHWRLKEAEEAEDTLKTAVKDFPWMFARLYQQLDISKAPPSVWGTTPRTTMETLQTESYAIRAKDIWNTPETLTFLRKMVEAVPKANPAKEISIPITMNDARHVLVSDIPQLISTLPREFTTMQTTSSDPLPPQDSVIDYVTGATDEDIEDEYAELEQQQQRAEQAGGAGGITGWLGAAINRFLSRAPDEPLTSEAIAEAQGRIQNGQDLGQELGMQRVRVRTVDEYEEAMSRGQYPVVDEDAMAAFNEELQTRHPEENEVREAAEEEAATRAALRRLEEQRAQARENERRQALRQATIEDEVDEDAPTAAPQNAEPQPYDEDANKRWLAGRGMLALKDFVAQKGSNENSWKGEAVEAITVPREYVDRVNLLRQRTNRNWILDFALKQGAGAEASEMVKRLLASGW